jgi:hypothetical protein
VFGIGCHWTTWTAPRTGPHLPHDEAVERFDVSAFVGQARQIGAGHVLFTFNHELHWLPCPNSATDRVMAGRTCKRDLIGELADSLCEAGIKLIGYYHHGCDAPTQDAVWQDAVGGHDADPTRLYANVQEITAELGERYGNRLSAWWFDAGWSLEKRGDTPWTSLASAAKAGYPDRLIAFNSGLNRFDPVTDCQDYWAGELEGLHHRPTGPQAPGGLQWYSFMTWQPGGGMFTWGIPVTGTSPSPARADAGAICEMARAYQAVGGCVTFNLLCYQDGSIHPADLESMTAAGQILKR